MINFKKLWSKWFGPKNTVKTLPPVQTSAVVVIKPAKPETDSIPQRMTISEQRLRMQDNTMVIIPAMEAFDDGNGIVFKPSDGPSHFAPYESETTQVADVRVPYEPESYHSEPNVYHDTVTSHAPAAAIQDSGYSHQDSGYSHSSSSSHYDSGSSYSDSGSSYSDSGSSSSCD